MSYCSRGLHGIGQAFLAGAKRFKLLKLKLFIGQTPANYLPFSC